MTRTDRRVRFLMVSNAASWGLVAFLALTGFAQKARPRFTEIDVERINIVGSNDRPVLVLSNRRLIPGPSINGKEYPRSVADGRELLSGMIFFNEEGDEVGGLIFNGIRKGSGYSSVGHLSFDQWKQNQVVALQYLDNGRSRRAGLRVWDRPTNVSLDKQLDRLVRLMGAEGKEREAVLGEIEAAGARGEFGSERLFVGSQDQTAQIQLRDKQGRVRIRLLVDAADAARLEFLDEAGKVVAMYPPTGPTK
jgi:hypothetical protein